MNKIICTWFILCMYMLKVSGTNLNYRVLGTTTAIFFQMIIPSMHLLLLMNVMLDFILWDHFTYQERVEIEKI